MNQFLINYPKSFTRAQIESDECKATVKDLEDYLTGEKIEELCVHEAGHLILARNARVKAFPVGPTIYLDGDGVFRYQASCVDIPEWKPKYALDYSKKLWTAIGKGLTAGGMFLEHFKHLPKTRWGDSDDRDQFKEYWRYAAREISVGPEDIEWEKARDRVRKYLSELRSSQVNDIEQAKAEVRATFIRPRLF